jgi:hypothetical protein
MGPLTNNWRKRRTEYRFMGKSQQTSQHRPQNVKTHTHMSK